MLAVVTLNVLTPGWMVVGIVTTRVLLMLTATGGADAADSAGAAVTIAVSVPALTSARLVTTVRICGTPMCTTPSTAPADTRRFRLPECGPYLASAGNAVPTKRKRVSTIGVPG